MGSRRKFINNTAWLLVMTVAQYIFPMFTFPYLTRVLEPDLYAVITYMTATISFVRIFMKFGFDLSSTKTITEHRGDIIKTGATVGSTMQSSAVLAALSTAVYTVMAILIPIMRENLLLAYLYLVGVFIEILLPDYLFLGLERMRSITGRYLVAKTISTVLTFVLVRSKQDILWVPVMNIIGNLVAALSIWYQILFSLKIKVSFSRWKEALKLLKVSAVYFISKFATTAFGAANTLMLGIVVMPKEQISYWGVSYNLVSMAISLYSPIMSSLYPHMIARRDTKLIRLLLGVLMPFIIAGSIGVYIYAKPFITLFCGPKYIGAIPVFQALLPILIFSFPAQLFGFPVLGTMGLVKETTQSTIGAAIFHMAGLLALWAFGFLTIFNMAVLRSFTEAVLLGLRSYYLWDYRRKRKAMPAGGSTEENE